MVNRSKIKLINLIDNKIIIGVMEEIYHPDTKNITYFKVYNPMMVGITPLGRHLSLDIKELVYMADYVPYTNNKIVYVSVDKLMYFPIDVSDKMKELYEISLEVVLDNNYNIFDDMLNISIETIKKTFNPPKEELLVSNPEATAPMHQKVKLEDDINISNSDKVISLSDAVAALLKNKQKLDS